MFKFVRMPETQSLPLRSNRDTTDRRAKENTGNSRTVQASWLTLAGFMSLSVGIITAAILSRFMTKSEYGTYRQVIYIYSTLLIIFSLGLPKAYSYFLARIPRDEGLDMVKKISMLFIGMAAVFSAVLLFGADTIAGLLGNPPLAENLRYFAVTPILLMPVMGVENVLTVYKMSRVVAVYATVSRLFMIICTVLPVVMIKADAKHAVIGFVVSSVITCISGYILIRLPFRNTVQRKTKTGLKEIIRFSKPVFTTTVYGFVISSTSLFFVGRYFGAEEFAMFANGYKELPFAGMIISAATAVLLPEFSKMQKTGAMNREFISLWKSVVYKSLSVICPLSLFCCVFAKDIICTIYGTEYSDASVLFQIITMINLTYVMPYNTIMLALDRGKELARAYMLAAALIVGLNIMSVSLSFHSITLITLIHTSCILLCRAMLMAVISRSLNTTVAKLVPWKKSIRILTASAAACIIAVFTRYLLGNMHGIAGLTTGFCIFIMTYCFIAGMAKIDYKEIFRPIISRIGIYKNNISDAGYA
ncbi:MAG: oligosaccharide flippase family protein [Prevotella sp.]|nr:oligosaccharide flippase family protein [Prevotella sp.]